MKAFWLFVGLFLALATNPASAQLGQSAAGYITPFCVHSPCAPRRLTYAQLERDNGTLATRQPIIPPGQPDAGYGTPQDIGLYPYGINGFDWELGGFSYLGDPTRVNDTECPTNRGFYCNSMTAWHIVYPRAATLHGSASPNNPATKVYYRNYQSWCHFTTGGWFLAQNAPTSGGLSTGLWTATQSSAVNQPTTDLGGGNYVMGTPTPGFANHGWITNQGTYTFHTVDQCYSQYEVRVDQPNANLLAASGMDWWASGGNTGYSQSIWVLLTQDWQRITGTSMNEAAFRADPPPPFVGVP